jgi:hypothetical protein
VTALNADVNGDGSVTAFDLTLATRSKGRKLGASLPPFGSPRIRTLHGRLGRLIRFLGIPIPSRIQAACSFERRRRRTAW